LCKLTKYSQGLSKGGEEKERKISIRVKRIIDCEKVINENYSAG
jgi:hypothetical protein